MSLSDVVTMPNNPAINRFSAAQPIKIYGERKLYDINIPAWDMTHESFRKWAMSDKFPEHGQISFIRGGLVLELEPKPLECHSSVMGTVVSVLHDLVRERQLGRFFMRGGLITNLDAELSVEPDAFYVSFESLRSGRARFLPDPMLPHSSKELIGTPDWILEIVSPTSYRKDKELLREAYYHAGVSEYWIIDPMGDKIDLEVLVSENGYQPVKHQDGWVASRVLGRSFRITREVSDLGFWNYTLQVRNESDDND